MFALAEVAQPGVDRALVLSQLVDNAGLKAGPSKKKPRLPLIPTRFPYSIVELCRFVPGPRVRNR